MAGGTGIEPATCGFGESGAAFFPVRSRLSHRARPEFKPVLVSGRLSTSEAPAVNSAVNMAQPVAIAEELWSGDTVVCSAATQRCKNPYVR